MFKIKYSKIIYYFFMITFLFTSFFNTKLYAITVIEEEQLGKEFLIHVKRNLQLIHDPLIINYVNKIGKQIVNILPSNLYNFNFYVVHEKVYNAFAGPGGHIVINSGLIEAMDSEQELAGILSHEIAHVICRHISERIEKSKITSFATLAGLIAGIMVGGDPGTALVLGSMAAQYSYELSYSRENEREADQNGIRYMTMAGYGINGLLTILKKIKSKSWIETTNTPTYVMTHPATNERMAYIDTYLEMYPEKANNELKIDPSDFKKVKSRIIALYGDIDNKNRLVQEVEKNTKDPFVYYGYALMCARIGQKQKAIKYMQKALYLRAFDPDMLKTLGELYFNNGQFDAAYKRLCDVLSINPDDKEACFLIANSLLKLEQYEKAIFHYNQLLQSEKNFPKLRYFLSEAYTKANKPGEAHYNLGIYYNQEGNIKGARFHLIKALAIYKNNPDKKKEIETILKNINKNYRFHKPS